MTVNRVSRILLRSIRVILDFIATVIGLRYPTNQRYLPPIGDRLLLESAVTISARIKSGQLKSETVVTAFIERCKLVQPHINAIIQDCYAKAINEAKQVDQRVKDELEGNQPKDRQSIHSLPLLGVPFTVKDTISVKGMYWTAGIVNRKDITAKEDSIVITNMRESGAILIAMTNVPEIGMWWDSYNKLFGRTYNPYDKSRIPGGSSGGEGSLISSVGSVIGVGADIGGSIRMPCYFCGIFGHKTTPGIVSSHGMFPIITPLREKLLSVGPMCRYATDLKPMLKVMAGLNADKLDLDKSVDLSQLKVYYMMGDNNPLNSRVQSDIKVAINKVVKHFDSKGLTTKKVYLKKINYGFNIWLTAMEDKSAPTMVEQLGDKNGPINPFIELIKSMFFMSNFTVCTLITCFSQLVNKFAGKSATEKFSKMRESLTQELHTLLGNDGILIYPAHPETAPKHNQTLLKVTNVAYTQVFNALNVSITSVPLGLSTGGLPVGVQVVVSPLNDRLGIAVAEELEKAFGGWVPPIDIIC